MKHALVLLFFVLAMGCADKRLAYTVDKPDEIHGNLRIDNNNLYVKILISGKDTLELFFDTGCVPGMILSDSIANQFIDPSELSKSAYFGNSKRQMVVSDSSLHNGIPIMIDSTTIDMAIISVIKNTEMMFGLGNRNNYRYWSIDYDKMKLSILPDSTDVDAIGATVWGFEPMVSQIILDIPMTFYRDGKALTVNHKWLMDTGAPPSVVITNPDEQIKGFIDEIPHIKIYDHGTEILSNKRLQYKFYLDLISFVNAGSLLKPTIVCVDEGWVNLMQQFGCMGAIGMDILNHYNTIIDFEEKKIILRPHNKNFDYYSPMIDSGLGFHLQPNGLVSHLEVGHSAQLAGLQLDDVIIKVNDEGFDRDELRKVKDGTSLKLTVKRNNEIREIQYLAKKTINKN